MIHGSPTDSGGLNSLLAVAGLPLLTEDQQNRFDEYLELILKWNAHTNLTSVRERHEILSRHFVECIACAQILPTSLGSLLDLGSGAGFPGIPISICRPELSVTLAESQNKKAAFLNEVVRVLKLNSLVFAGRAEAIQTSFDCVTLRAVDQMKKAIETGLSLLDPGGMLVVMTTDLKEPEVRATASVFSFKTVRLPGSAQRVVLWGNRA